MIKIQLKDNTKARHLSFNKLNHYKTQPGKKAIRAQHAIYDYLKKRE